jgi:hypothetical protein
MSHLIVAVIHTEDESLDTVLDPFWELDLSEEERKCDYRSEYSPEYTPEEAEKGRLGYIQDYKDKIKKKEFRKPAEHEKDRPLVDVRGTKEYMEKQIEIYSKMTAKEYMKDYYGYAFNKNDGTYGYYYNPNAKWDWWTLGGRWKGYLKLKEGATGEEGESGVFRNKGREGYVDSARVGDIDFEGMKKDSLERAKKSWLEFKKDPSHWGE